jgi:signal peptidase II
LERGLKNNILDYALLVSLAAIIVILDQWTKMLVRSKLAFEEMWAPWDWLLPYARIVHWKNTGAAFGMLQGFSDVFTILAIVVSIAIIFYYPQVPHSDWPLRVAMGMQLGGAMGNLIDRLTRGYVTDFISVGTFPVFNVADSSISVGVAILILGMWIKERQARQAETDLPPTPPAQPESQQEGTRGE